MGSNAVLSEQKQILASWQRWTLRAGLTALTLLLAIELAALTWRVVAPEPLVLAAPSQTSNQSQNKVVANTAQYHLFGEVGAEPLPEVSEETSAPDTRLRLQLLGVTRATKPELSSAIIAPNGGEGDFYRVGSIVQGSTRLAAVYDNRVILDTNGKLETLKFEEVSSGVTATMVNTPTRRQQAAPANSNRRSSIRERFNNVKTPTEFMEMVSEEVARNPNSALHQLGLESTDNGQGYRVGNGSVLTALQLQPGDIVLSVNGQTLGNPEADQVLLEQVSTSGSARIEVQRGNNRFVVNHSLN